MQEATRADISASAQASRDESMNRNAEDYRLDFKLRNNRILAAIEEAGYRSVKHFAEANDLPYSQVASMVAMTSPALNQDGTWRRVAVRVATALKVLPDFLFNERQAEGDFEKTRFSKAVSEESLRKLAGAFQAVALFAPDDPDKLAEERNLVSVGLSNPKLTAREFDCLVKRYGLDGDNPMTLDEIAQEVGSGSRERIRQWLLSGEKKMREQILREQSSANSNLVANAVSGGMRKRKRRAA